MRDEYDFSKAVRGKYADRFREGVKYRELRTVDQLRHEELLHWMGAALRETQQVELFLTSCVVLSFSIHPREAADRVSRVLSQADNWDTLLSGSVLAQYEHAIQDLERYNVFRHWLIHSSALFTGHDDLAEVLERLEAETSQTTELCRRLSSTAFSLVKEKTEDKEEQKRYFNRLLESLVGAEGEF